MNTLHDEITGYVVNVNNAIDYDINTKLYVGWSDYNYETHEKALSYDIGVRNSWGGYSIFKGIRPFQPRPVATVEGNPYVFSPVHILALAYNTPVRLIKQGNRWAIDCIEAQPSYICDEG